MRNLAASVNNLTFSIVCVVVWLLVLALPLNAQAPKVLDDDELYERASNSSDNKDYVAAMIYIYAYIQRNNKVMKTDSKYHSEVVQFYETVKNLAYPVAGVRSIWSTPPRLPPKPKAQPSQLGSTLVCRGGGNLRFTYISHSNISDQAEIWVTFERGTGGVGANKENIAILGPGQCTWLDRAVSHEEPDTLVLTEPVFQGSSFGIVWQAGKVPAITSQHYYISKLQREDRIQIFSAYNDGKGNFIVTRIE